MFTSRSWTGGPGGTAAIVVLSLVGALGSAPVRAQENPDAPKSPELRAVSVGFTTFASEHSGNPMSWLVGFRVDPGQDKQFGPTFSASLWPFALTGGYAVIAGEAGVAMRLQGDQMALIPRLAAAPVAVVGSGGSAMLTWSIGVGWELRQRGAEHGVRIDVARWGEIGSGSGGSTQLALHFIL